MDYAELIATRVFVITTLLVTAAGVIAGLLHEYHERTKEYGAKTGGLSWVGYAGKAVAGFFIGAAIAMPIPGVILSVLTYGIIVAF